MFDTPIVPLLFLCRIYPFSNHMVKCVLVICCLSPNSFIRPKTGPLLLIYSQHLLEMQSSFTEGKKKKRKKPLLETSGPYSSLINQDNQIVWGTGRLSSCHQQVYLLCRSFSPQCSTRDQDPYNRLLHSKETRLVCMVHLYNFALIFCIYFFPKYSINSIFFLFLRGMSERKKGKHCTHTNTQVIVSSYPFSLCCIVQQLKDV